MDNSVITSVKKQIEAIETRMATIDRAISFCENQGHYKQVDRLKGQYIKLERQTRLLRNALGVG